MKELYPNYKLGITEMSAISEPITKKTMINSAKELKKNKQRYSNTNRKCNLKYLTCNRKTKKQSVKSKNIKITKFNN
jgi:hypothetical protein